MRSETITDTSRQGDPLIKFLIYTFFAINGVLPAIALFWNMEIHSLQVNWFIYPVFVVIAVAVFILRFRATAEMLVFIAVVLFFGVVTFINDGNVLLLIRIVITLLPLALLRYFEEKDTIAFRLFGIFFTLSIIVALYSVYLQLTGKIPYYTAETIEGEWVGRISGGYAKPTALGTFLFPVFIYGFYLRLVKRKYFSGHVISMSLLAFIVIVAHRTTTIAFIIIYIASFFPVYANAIITWYYKKLIPFWAGIGGFVLIQIVYNHFGLVEALRGRLPMWMAHADQFWKSPVWNILFGKQVVMLGEKWGPWVWALDEVHNNSFRTIVYFGVVGYLLYCLFLRYIVLYLNQNHSDPRIKFIMFSCFFYFILFAFTNEHTAYPTIIWPTFVWIFLLTGTNNKRTTLDAH